MHTIMMARPPSSAATAAAATARLMATVTKSFLPLPLPLLLVLPILIISPSTLPVADAFLLPSSSPASSASASSSCSAAQFATHSLSSPSSASAAAAALCGRLAPTRTRRSSALLQGTTPSSETTSASTSATASDTDDILERIQAEWAEAYTCAELAFGPLLRSDGEDGSEKATAMVAAEIVRLCDEIDALRVGASADDDAVSNSADTSENDESGDTLNKQNEPQNKNKKVLLTESLHLKLHALSYRRYQLLTNLMTTNYDAYVATASFLGNRIARHDLPNVQDVPYPDLVPIPAAAEGAVKGGENEQEQQQQLLLVPDCTMEPLQYQDSPLDKILLSVFRNLVKTNTGGITSSRPGIEGLLDQGRSFMLQPDQSADNQHKMVRETLGGLMTPVLPPFYRIFMSGIVPDWEWIPEGLRGKQFGPWFYAPYLTSVVTPTFFAFLVGPSRPNRRRDDGQRGGLLVEKCKFLQESGCKGLCLHQCKLPAQQFFRDELGLALTVSPNFETQECQWSFGEEPLEPNDDPSFPKGCLVGCESRRQVAEMGGGKADLCSV